MAAEYEPLARLLLRSEGVASSFIEGIAAPIVDVVLAEELLGRHGAGAGAWDAVAAGSKAQRTLIANVEAITQQWRQFLASTERKPRADAALVAALHLLPRHLVLTSRTLIDELAISRKAALATLHRLVEVGVLTAYGTVQSGTSGQPAARFVSRDLLGLAGANPLQ